MKLRARGSNEYVDIEYEEKEYKHIPDIGYKLGYNILPNNIIERMKRLTSRSEEIGKEIGFKLCTEYFNPYISTGMTCIGTDSCITTLDEKRQGCPKGKYLIGEFHTHPGNYEANMSAADASRAYVYGIECIGIDKEISCYIRKSDDIDDKTLNKFQFFSNKIQKIEKKIEKRRKDIWNE